MRSTLGPNPFEDTTPGRLASVYRAPDEAARFILGYGDYLQVVGRSGMGKTTLLRQAMVQLEATGVPARYIYIPASGLPEPVPVSKEWVLFMDETDRLPLRQLVDLLRRVKSTGSRIALGTHRSHAPVLALCGLQGLRVRLVPLLRPDDAAAIFCQRCALALGDQADAFRVPDATGAALLRHSRGNIGRIMQLGYEIFEAIEEPRPITPADVALADQTLRNSLRVGAASR